MVGAISGIKGETVLPGNYSDLYQYNAYLLDGHTVLVLDDHSRLRCDKRGLAESHQAVADRQFRFRVNRTCSGDSNYGLR